MVKAMKQKGEAEKVQWASHTCRNELQENAHIEQRYALWSVSVTKFVVSELHYYALVSDLRSNVAIFTHSL